MLSLSKLLHIRISLGITAVKQCSDVFLLLINFSYIKRTRFLVLSPHVWCLPYAVGLQTRSKSIEFLLRGVTNSSCGLPYMGLCTFLGRTRNWQRRPNVHFAEH
jgi:hypothetical protein